MLRHLLNLSILCASVLFAGMPAVLCAGPMPMHHCCPSAPGEACPGHTPQAPKGLPAKLACCAVEMADETAITASAAILKIEKHAELTDPPATISGFSSPT